MMAKLHVAEYLYKSAAPLFDEIHRKINENEPPYVFAGNAECNEPRYSPA